MSRGLENLSVIELTVSKEQH